MITHHHRGSSSHACFTTRYTMTSLISSIHILRYSQLTQLVSWLGIYRPPTAWATDTQDENTPPPLPQVLAAAAGGVIPLGTIIYADSRLLVHFCHIVQVVKTTALLLHDAYTPGAAGGGLDAATACSLAQQVVKSGLLHSHKDNLPSCLLSAAAELERRATSTVQQDDGTAAGSAQCRFVLFTHALLQLASAIIKMWPGGIFKSKAAASLAAPAVQLAFTTLATICDQQQQQLSSTGARVLVILSDALDLAELLILQLPRDDDSNSSSANSSGSSSSSQPAAQPASSSRQHIKTSSGS